MKLRPVVTVFGSSIPLPGDEEYETAYRLGGRLGGGNLKVCTGGYQGIMDAVSRGAAESGSDAIGITTREFSSTPSKYLTEEIKCENLLDRIRKLIEMGDAYIVLRGGTGTLVELAIAWEYMNKSIIGVRPFACHGSMWKNIIEALDERMLFERRRAGIVNYFSDIDACADYIIESLRLISR